MPSLIDLKVAAVTAFPTTPAADTIYIKKRVGDTRCHVKVTTSATPGPVAYVDLDTVSLGAMEVKYTVVTANTTLDETHYYVAVDCTTGDKTITLPPVATCLGRMYFIKKIDSSSSNHVTIAPDGSETIEGITPIYLGTQWQYLWVIAGVGGWEILGALD